MGDPIKGHRELPVSRLSVHLFGYPKVAVDDLPVKLERRKSLALLAYLASATHDLSDQMKTFGREQLAALLWPDCWQDQAGAYLRQALWDITRAAGESWLMKDGAYLSLDPQAEIWVDAAVFEARYTGWKCSSADGEALVSQLHEAAQLYSADFLEGLGHRL